MMIELKHAGHVHGICKDLYKGFAHYITTSCRINKWYLCGQLDIDEYVDRPWLTNEWSNSDQIRSIDNSDLSYQQDA